MKRWNANLPALVLLFALLLVWQLGATGMDAAYILPSPTQILVRMWELREPLLTAHLPATLLCTGIGPVSYTHLDVYKRQGFNWAGVIAWIVGSAIALLLPELLIPTLNAIVIACILYLILYPIFYRGNRTGVE